MTTSTSLISVLLPVYNCQEYIYEAVQSILNQTYSNFELIIIDDCSTDNTVKIIKEFNDERIRLVVKEKNSGYTDSLNYAVTISNGEFIARMDGDDISLPERFAKQINFFETNADALVCGTAIQIIDSHKILKHPTSNDEIKVKLCFSNSFYHPTMMFKRQVLVDNKYDKNFEPAEDYDLWTKLIFKMKMFNLDEVLLNYRVHANQISNYKQEMQLNSGAISQLRMFQILFETKVIDFELFKIAFKEQPTSSTSDLKRALHFFNEIKSNNKRLKIYSEIKFENQLDKVRTNFLKNYIRSNGFSFKYILSYLIFCNFKDFYKAIGIKKRFKKLYNK